MLISVMSATNGALAVSRAARNDGVQLMSVNCLPGGKIALHLMVESE